jgi:hypothetical protein
LIAVLGALFILAVLVLSVPVEAIFSFDTSTKPKVHIKLSWFYGLVTREMRGFSGARKKRAKKRGRRISQSALLKIISTRRLLNRISSLAWSILQRVKLQELKADLIMGLDDPADTGLLFALVGPVLPLVNLPEQCNVSVMPSFQEAVLEGKALLVIRLRPITLTIPFMKFIFSMPVIRAGKTMLLG